MKPKEFNADSVACIFYEVAGIEIFIELYAST